MCSCHLNVPPLSNFTMEYQKRYTLQQRFFIAAWQECYQSTVLTQRKFRQKFGRGVPVPVANTIKNIHRKAAETGTLTDDPRSGRPRSSGSEENLGRLSQSMAKTLTCPFVRDHAKLIFRENQSGVYCETICRRIRTGRKFSKPLAMKIRQCDRRFARRCL